jgi:hypothetical protein
MNGRILPAIALTGALVLAACSQDQGTTASVPTEASLAKVTVPTCSFSTANNDARTYFTSNKDAVFARIDAMQTAYKANDAAGATSAGFDVLARVESALSEGAVKGSAAQGSKFVNDVFLCMQVTGYTDPMDFSDALGPNGLFAVRDGSTNAAVTSHLLGNGAPAYGAEPSTGNWPVAGKTLFYGVKLGFSSLANEPEAGVLFELSTLPSGLTFSPEIRTGVCTIDDDNARILHLHAGDPAVILPPTDALSFCPTTSTSRTPAFSGFAFLSRAAEWLAPAPLHAATMAPVRSGGGAGLVSGLSEIGPVSFVSVVSFSVPPQTTRLSANPQFVPTVTVVDTTSHGNPIKGVLITLTVVGNNGSYTITGNTATTNSSGVATFPDLHIDKAGGYTVTATSEVGGTATAGFNISGL